MDEFLTGTAERASWTQLGGDAAARITDPDERDHASARNEHGCDRVGNTEGVYGCFLERRSQQHPLAATQSN